MFNGGVVPISAPPIGPPRSSVILPETVNGVEAGDVGGDVGTVGLPPVLDLPLQALSAPSSKTPTAEDLTMWAPPDAPPNNASFRREMS
jgi:hypothetical protein